jgi:hypothetical protein
MLKCRSINCVILVEWRRQGRRIAREFADVAAYGHGSSIGIRLRDPARAPFFSAKLMLHWRPSRPARIKLESSVDHDDGSRMIPGLITHVSQCFCASYKEAAAQTALISNHPVAAAISTDHKDRRTRRRFAFRCCSHCMSPDASSHIFLF